MTQKKHKRVYKDKTPSSKQRFALRNTILRLFVEKKEVSMNLNQVASALSKTTHKEKDELIKEIKKLHADGKLKEVSKGKYKLVKSVPVEGIISFTSSRAAYVNIEGEEEDIYIARGRTANALNGDRVSLYIYAGHKNKKLQGEVLNVLKRKRKHFVGIWQYNEEAEYGFVITDKNQSHVDLYVSKENIKGAKKGEKVIAVITNWPSEVQKPFGKIIAVLGPPGEHEVEIHAILADYNLPHSFPKEIEKEANNIPVKIQSEEITKRRDMRSITTFTIDPTDAKDFDDALSFKPLENGNVEVGVHIADVSHYVQPGTLLNQEAYRRATSIYLVDRVVPMLPEILSNNICSLRPNEEKLTFSACFEMTPRGKIVKQWLGKTIILSDRRFTYEEVQQIIEKGEGSFKEEILNLNKLAKILRKKRIQSGTIGFDKIELKFKLDENADPVGVYIKQSKDAHKLIEEFMLLANRKVSEFISLNKSGKPTKNTFIYRIHDEPDPEKLRTLKTFIYQFGYDLDLTDRRTTMQSMNILLTKVKGKPEANMIETLAMRTMSKAKYSTNNIGHYGLNFSYYSHFTSPIRRYPDIIAHRLLAHYLSGNKSPDKALYEKDCVHCSNQEILSVNAERDSVKYMQAKYLTHHVGEIYKGIISGVTEWGIYVELLEFLCEGMVSLKDIKDDYYRFDAKNFQAVGRRTGNRYRLGDTLTIKVKQVNLERKQIDFEIAPDIT